MEQRAGYLRSSSESQCVPVNPHLKFTKMVSSRAIDYRCAGLAVNIQIVGLARINPAHEQLPVLSWRFTNWKNYEFVEAPFVLSGQRRQNCELQYHCQLVAEKGGAPDVPSTLVLSLSWHLTPLMAGRARRRRASPKQARLWAQIQILVTLCDNHDLASTATLHSRHSTRLLMKVQGLGSLVHFSNCGPTSTQVPTEEPIANELLAIHVIRTAIA